MIAGKVAAEKCGLRWYRFSISVGDFREREGEHADRTLNWTIVYFKEPETVPSGFEA